MNNEVSEKAGLVQMTVAGITLDPSNNMPIIILKDIHNQIAIPIWIGLVEASAIATELEGIQLGRPMTHDLLKNVLEALNARLSRIVVSELKENTFYAILHLEQDGRTLEVDSRPSDAIALALRVRADIFVAQEVIDSSQQLDMGSLKEVLEPKSREPKSPEEAESGEPGEQASPKSDKDRWSEILENLKPEDFGKYKM